MNQHTCLLSFHGAHVAKPSRLSSSETGGQNLHKFTPEVPVSCCLDDLDAKKRLVSLLAVCETCVTHVSHVPCGNLSDWHFQELARKVHAWQVEDSSPTSHEVTQIDSNSLRSF